MDNSPNTTPLGLGNFFEEWKEEILSGHQIENCEGVVKPRKRSFTTPDSDNSDETISSKVQRQYERTSNTVHDSEVAPLLVLTSPAMSSDTFTHGSSQSEHKLCTEDNNNNKHSGSLVDKLISDFNEVNTVPFFDIQLPREVALIIFGHLGMKDLCRCSAVSKSWKFLAEDNVLWANVCKQMGYDISTDVNLEVRWRVVVKEIVEHRKEVLQNWKERKCGVKDHQPDNAGVLIAASYSEQTLLSCYTSGQVHVWRIGDHSEPVNVKYPSAQSINTPTCCATSNGWGAVGTKDGRVRLIDVDTCSEVECLVEAGSVGSLDIAVNGDRVVVAAVTSQTRFNGSTTSKITTFFPRDDSWDRLHIVRDSPPVTQMELVSLHQDSDQGVCVLYSTSTSLFLQPLYSSPVPILTSSGLRGANYISCFDTCSPYVACGTSTFGYKVQVYEMPSGSMKSSLRGHTQHVTCVHLPQSSPDSLVSGSADKQVRVFDCRSGSSPVLSLRGHSSAVHCLKMDDWKVVSGSSDGCLIIWDQRLPGELWRSHERHPIALCEFDEKFLVVCCIPTDKQPAISSGNPFICHRRHRGLIRMYDFSADPLNYRNLLPSICSSAYDEPGASFFNLDLKYPYDNI